MHPEKRLQNKWPQPLKTLKKKVHLSVGVLTIRVVSKSVDVEAVFSGGQSFNLPRQLHRSRLVLGEDPNQKD